MLKKGFDLAGKKLMIGLPAYDHKVGVKMAISLMQLGQKLMEHGIDVQVNSLCGCSVVSRARNIIAHQFLKSDCDHLMFIDADIEFQVEDVIKLIAHNKEVAVGAYPKKGVNWQRIRESVKQTDQPFDDKAIASFGSDYAINFKFINRDAKQIAIENGLIRLHDGATGFMMIKREVIQKMIEKYPELKYNNDLNTPPELNPHFYAFFDTMIDPKDRRYLSEDYTFSRRWQEIGGEIWLDPSISLNHYGSFNFQGNPQQIIQIG